MKKIAVVTGASRGIGKEIAEQLSGKGWEVIATGRSFSENASPAQSFRLDVTDPGSCRKLYEFLRNKYDHMDVLVNNAGIIGQKAATAFDMEQVHEVMNTNFFGAMNVSKALWPLLLKSKEARLINMSSGMGSLQDVQLGGYAAYRLSKWSLNGWTMLLAADAPANIKVNSMCPGWCQTDMGGPGATRSAAKGAETAVWLATEENIPSGKFWRDKKEIPW